MEVGRDPHLSMKVSKRSVASTYDNIRLPLPFHPKNELLGVVN
jgi:hypothetical protein